MVRVPAPLPQRHLLAAELVQRHLGLEQSQGGQGAGARQRRQMEALHLHPLPREAHGENMICPGVANRHSALNL